MDQSYYSGGGRPVLPDRLMGALTRLHAVCAQSGVSAVLAGLRPSSGQQRPDVPRVLACFAAWSAAQPRFAESEAALLQAAGLACLVDRGWWAELVTALARTSMSEAFANSVTELCARLDAVVGSFPAMARLLGDEAVAGPDEPGLRILVSGPEGGPPSLSRIAGVIEAAEALWSTLVALDGRGDALLQLAGVELGSPVALRFDGAPHALEEMRGLLSAIGERAGQLGTMSPSQQAAVVPAMLPISDRIARSGRPDMGRLRDGLERGVRGMLENGCSLFAERAAAAVDPASLRRTLMDVAQADISHLAGMIAEERRQLEVAVPPHMRRMWTGAEVPARAG